MFVYNNIDFAYTKQSLLQQVSITLQPGELILLRGPNGAGKTTLLKILAGLLEPRHCEVQLPEGQGSWKSLRHYIRSYACYLHQTPYMFAGSVIHNLSITSRQKTKQNLYQALSLVGIDHLAQHDASTLSGGERQRLAIARAYLHQPSILLLDEPLANMDSLMIERTLELITQFKNSGSAILLCSHLHEELNQIADKKLILENGQIDNN